MTKDIKPVEMNIFERDLFILDKRIKICNNYLNRCYKILENVKKDLRILSEDLEDLKKKK